MKSYKCGCGKDIHPERYDLGYKICISCGEKFASVKKPKGFMYYGHKTAGSIVITSSKGFDNYRKVSYRKNKGSHMGYACNIGTSF